MRSGIINGKTTQEIAEMMAVDVLAAGRNGVSLGATGKQIRSQAMAMARTATQDMARQVKEQFYEENKDATEGMVWMWTTALDSRTCETCSPLDGRRWRQGENGRPSMAFAPKLSMPMRADRPCGSVLGSNGADSAADQAG